MDIVINRRSSYFEAVVAGDKQEARVFLHQRNTGFGLKFKSTDGRWYSQWLMWSCRGGRASYFPAMVALYRELVRNCVVPRGSLRRLAG